MSQDETITVELTYDDVHAMLVMAAIVRNIHGTEVPLEEGRKVFELLRKLQPELERMGWTSRPA